MPMVILFHSLHNPLKKAFKPGAEQQPVARCAQDRLSTSVQ
jgi:hypothetical protein